MRREFTYSKSFLDRGTHAAEYMPAVSIRAGYSTKIYLFSNKQDQNIPWMNDLRPEGRGGDGPQRPRRNPFGFIMVISLIVLFIGGLFGLALYREKDITDPTNVLVASTSGTQSVSCQYLIDRAMQASEDSCYQLGTNQVCYGNNTLLAELIEGAASQFNQRGDRVNVTDLRRLVASPLSLASEDWGIAVFKVMANLPRSLPGETITMVVFGNTTLDNMSDDLQTFYFSSTLGKIDCNQVPFDGLMITMPDGAGVRFVINGAEMVLMGNASITATQNGTMDVNLYSGSASIISNGQNVVVTAGQTTSMELGGPDGRTAVGAPSAPQPIEEEKMTLACTLTGNFCSQQQITPVDPFDAVATLISKLGLDNPTTSVNSTPVPTIAGNPTLIVFTQQPGSDSPSLQSYPTTTFINTSTNPLLPTLTFTIQPSFTNTLPPVATNTAVPPTSTYTLIPPTATNPPAPTAVPLITICHATSSGTYEEITIPNTGSGGHWNHPDDIIPAPAGGCP